MEYISEVINKSLKGRLGHMETLLFNNSVEDSLMQNLYNGLSNGEFSTDEEARAALYGEKENSSKYKMLKKRFFERVTSAVLLTQPKVEQSSIFLKNLHYCHKNLIVARLLIFTGATKTGVMLLKKVLKKAIEIEQYEIVQICALMLRQQSVYAGEEKHTREYNHLFMKAIKTVRAEAFAEEKYQGFIIQYTQSRSKKLHLAANVARTATIVEKLSRQYGSYQLQLYSFRLNALSCELNGKYEQLLTLANEHEKFLVKHKPFYSLMRHANVLQFGIASYLHLGKYREGIKAIHKALHLISDHSPNWFSIQELHFLMLLNTDQPESAGEVYQAVTNSPTFNSLRANSREVWKILGAYLWFLLKLNENDELITKIFPKREKFRFSTFLNDLPIYSRDKQGLYVSVLLLQVLLLMLEKNSLRIGDRIEALRVYQYRRLNDVADYRTRQYVKMLQYLEKYDYDVKALTKKTPAFLKSLESKAALVNSDLQLEVLRYEKQWEIILKLCENLD